MLNQTTTGTSTTVRTLLYGAIDYAGLFPPAGLSMAEAVLNYATYRAGSYSWMLGRFVVNATRLDEFYEHARELISGDATSPWRVAVVVVDDVVRTIDQVKQFNAANGPNVICDTLEIKAEWEGIVENAAMSMPKDLTAYFEVPLDKAMPDIISALAIRGQRAKIRTGGVTPEAFPSTKAIIRFVRACLAANVPFKATAGLHHPIRCFRPLTYEADSPKGTMHGFLNLFLMTAFAREGYRPSLLHDVMEEEFEEVFRFDDKSVTWRDEYVLTDVQIDSMRSQGLQSFGSCSFEEPVADLQKLGIL
jgi:hypothetical protein